MKTMAVVIALLGLAWHGVSQAQYIFLDTNGDALFTELDELTYPVTTATVVLQTDVNRDQSPMRYRAQGDRLPTINSYEFILRVEDGAVEWGEYTNLLPSMTIALETYHSDSEYYTGFAGSSALPPGKYSLGRLTLRVKSGSPRLKFASHSDVYARGGTSFGSHIPGKDMDNTLKFYEGSVGIETSSQDGAGDWSDATGLESSPVPALKSATTTGSGRIARLELSPISNPISPAGHLRLRIPSETKVTLRLFDASGRLIATLLEHRRFEQGEHLVSLIRPTAGQPILAGVYFYKLETEFATRTGRIILVK